MRRVSSICGAGLPVAMPHTQYFAAPFALHSAYWHEDFDAPKSAGCVNLSPTDAAWLFDWTEPRVPEAWSGAIAGGAMGSRHGAHLAAHGQLVFGCLAYGHGQADNGI